MTTCLNSEDINELVTALSKAQGEITPASKDNLNPHFKSKYADLNSVWNACRSALSKNGLAVLQSTTTQDGQLVLVTTLAHASGQWMRSYMPVITQRNDAQGLGSALTYTRRYSLAAIVGVAPDDDDDGEASKRVPVSNKQPPKAEVKIISKDQAGELYEMLMQCDSAFVTNTLAFCKKNGYGEDLSRLSIEMFDRLSKAIFTNLEKCKADLHSESDSDEAMEA